MYLWLISFYNTYCKSGNKCCILQFACKQFYKDIRLTTSPGYLLAGNTGASYLIGMKKSGVFKHGLNHHPLYHVWTGMKSRCNSTQKSLNENWGGRGITYCREWETFIPFFCWAVTHGYKKGLALDRIDNDGNYSPTNCRFTDWSTQNKNKRKYRSMPRNV